MIAQIINSVDSVTYLEFSVYIWFGIIFKICTFQFTALLGNLTPAKNWHKIM